MSRWPMPRRPRAYFECMRARGLAAAGYRIETNRAIPNPRRLCFDDLVTRLFAMFATIARSKPPHSI